MARQRWLARASVLLVCVALVLLVGVALHRDLWRLLVVMLGAAVVVASTYGFLAHRGALRLVALALLLATPVAVVWVFARNGPLWVALGVVLAMGLSMTTGRAGQGPPADVTGQAG
jgi:hypothetical protein